MTQQTTASPFLHGASWVRADFHLHTIKDLHSSRKKLRQEWLGKEDEFARAFVDRLISEEIKVACITNHDSLDYHEFKAIARKARAKEILVLPGIELSIQGGSCGIHTLIIFDPEELNRKDTRIDDFLKGQFPGGRFEDKVSEDDLPKCFEKLEKLGINYFVVFAHVEADNGLLGALKGPNLQQVYQSTRTIWKERVVGFQKCRSAEEILVQKLGEIPKPALVEGSDPRDSIDELGRPSNGVCYLKISQLSFSAVKFALKDHRLRVSSTPPTSKPRPKLISLEIQTQAKGLFGHFFSADLNCLIGSRGAGKSLIIESLRWALGQESGTGDETYKAGLLKAFLQKGGRVTVRATDQDDAKLTITRHYLGETDQSPPQIEINGNAASVSLDSLLPGLLYFGQKDLGIRSEQSDSQLFNQLLGPVPVELSQAVAAKEKKLREHTSSYQEALKAKTADEEYAYELNSLNAKLASFREKGVEDKLKAITSFDSDLRTFESFLKSFKVQRTATAEQHDSLIATLSTFPELKSQENLKARELLNIYRTAFLERLPEIKKIDDLLDETLKGLDLVKRELEQNRFELQSRFAEILRSIDEPDLDLEGYRTMVARQKQLAEIRKISQGGGDAISTAKRSLIAVGDEWLAALREISNHQNSQLAHLSTGLPEKLNLEIEAFGEKERFNAYLDGLMKGSGFTSQARETLVSQTSSGFEIFKRWESLKRSELSPAMVERLETAMADNFLEFITFATPDRRHITFEERRITDLSLGKRAMALLVLLLSLKNYPIIIIDQPEDDLDNETIHRMIVEPLRQHKGHTQFIIATHNPNIPVLADAEQVIACYESAKGEYDHTKAGSLDKAEIKEAIITIMEGGEQAFQNRHRIYSEWTK